jgi:Gpi18-like mannosyltransferase
LPFGAARDALTRRLGGRLGRHASQVRAGGLNLWVFLIAVATWIIAMVRQLPCRTADSSKAIDVYSPMCYSDIGILYRIRGFASGLSPYTDFDWEYPALTGMFADLARRLTDLLGFASGEGLDAQTILSNSNVYTAVTAVGLFACFLGVVAVQRRLMGGHPWGVAALAAAPAVMTTGLINWDLFAVFLCSLGLLAYTRDHPVRAGIWLGLAVAAKFYPVVVLGALFLLCWRSRRFVFYVRLLGAAVAAWIAANLPVIIASVDGWRHFYTFNQGRGPDLGSLWHALALLGSGPANAQNWAIGIMAVCYAGLAAITLLAPVKPRPGQVVFLAVAILVTFNMVYSPQYVLWLLPLVLWARPAWRDFAAWALAELVYFAAIWLFLGGASEDPPAYQGFYILAILIRLAATWWVMARVVRDICVPDHDPSAAERDLTDVQRVRLGVGPAPLPDETEIQGQSAEPLFPAAWAPRGAVLAWAFSRLTLLFTAVVVGSSQGLGGLAALGHWDSDRVIRLADQGYPVDDLSQAAIFPGLPLLLRGLHAVGLPYIIAGLLVSLVASALAAWALYRLARGGVAGAVAVAAWSFAPMAVFTVVPYTESLFLAFALWAWLKARDDQWRWAGLLAFGACFVRVSGLFLVGALVLLAVWGYGKVDWRRFHWADLRRRLAWLALPLLALFSYTLYLRFHYGSWTTWMTAQEEGWSRSFHWPWEGLKTTLCAAHWDSSCSAGYDVGNAAIFSAEIIAVIAGFILTVVLLWRRRVPEAGWVGVQAGALACQIWFLSVARTALLWFPLWTTLGEIAGAKLKGQAWRLRLGLALVWLALSALLMVAWAVRFYNGAWAG